MSRQLSEGRKATYYVGSGIAVLGLLLFLSVFVSAAIGDMRPNSTMPLRAVSGFILMFVGGVVASIGSRGLAGSGVILDPEQAEEELETYSRMAGGMLKDAMDEAQFSLGGKTPEKIIMVRCRECGKLNNEDAKFCQECGKPI
jgi:hypothetical protein